MDFDTAINELQVVSQEDLETDAVMLQDIVEACNDKREEMKNTLKKSLEDKFEKLLEEKYGIQKDTNEKEIENVSKAEKNNNQLESKEMENDDFEFEL